MVRLVSVIVPAYNVANYLDVCIESLVRQTYEKIEIIVIDDGSTDETGNVCEKWKRDARVFVIRQDNQGLSMARNVGMQHAHGDYITFVDGDDYVSQDYIRHLVDAIEKHNTSLAIVDYQVVPQKGKARKGHIDTEGCISSDVVLQKGMEENSYVFVSAWGKLYKKSLWDELEFPPGKCHEDEFLIYKLIDAAGKIAVCNDVDYYYVVRPGSITNSRFHLRRLDKVEALKEKITYFKIKENQKLLPYCYKQYLMQLQLGYCRLRHYYPKERTKAKEYRDEAIGIMQNCRQMIKKVSGAKEYLSMKVFLYMPVLYRMAISIYDKKHEND